MRITDLRDFIVDQRNLVLFFFLFSFCDKVRQQISMNEL